MAKAHLTPDGWRCEKQKEHLYRAKWMNYRSPSIQLLTMVTSDRLPLLGELQGQHIALTPLGQKVAEEIERIPTYKGASSIEIYNYVIMPDHIHIVLIVQNASNEDSQNSSDGPSRTSAPTGSRQHTAVSRFVSTFKRFCNKEYGVDIWQRGYYDHIIRNNDDYEEVCRYIHENPLRWEYDHSK